MDMIYGQLLRDTCNVTFKLIATAWCVVEVNEVKDFISFCDKCSSLYTGGVVLVTRECLDAHIFAAKLSTLDNRSRSQAHIRL